MTTHQSIKRGTISSRSSSGALMVLRLPAFLAISILFGGSSLMAGWPKYLIYFASIILIGWALGTMNIRRLGADKLSFYSAVLILLVIQILYLIPLPPVIWTHLPGREIAADAFLALDLTLPWMPLSMTPEESLFYLYTFLPPVAALLTVTELASDREVRLACWTVPVMAACSVVLGIIQISDGSRAFYFYEITNPHSPVGFFANVNHQATLLLMALPFTLSILRAHHATFIASFQRPKLLGILGIVLLLVLSAGLLTNGSLAGYYLMIVSLALSVYLLRTGQKNMIWLIAPAIVVIGIFVLDMLFLSSALKELGVSLQADGQVSRGRIFATTWTALMDFFPVGSGAGSFASIYPMFEDKGLITSVYAPHAHNDYLEFVLEFGLPGLVLIIVFLAYWGRQARRIVLSGLSRSDPAFAAIVSTFILILHSLVDYPARTPAIAVLGAFCLGLMLNGQYRLEQKG